MVGFLAAGEYCSSRQQKIIVHVARCLLAAVLVIPPLLILVSCQSTLDTSSSRSWATAALCAIGTVVRKRISRERRIHWLLLLA